MNLRNLSLVALSAIVLAGCGKPQATPKEIASCAAAAASPELIERLGLEFGRTSTVPVGDLDVSSCKAGAMWPFNSELRKAVAVELPEAFIRLEGFRGGAYSALLNPDATKPQRESVAHLGLKLEAFANAREAGLNCLKMPEPMLVLMQGYDSVFATAVLGVSGGVTDAGAAHVLAEDLVARARTAAAMVQDKSCESTREPEVRGYATELQEFMEGKHPWAKGCSTSMDADGLKLSCAKP